jgi:hypothetical protein
MVHPNSPTAALKQNLLLARAETGVKTSVMKIQPPESEMPQSGHSSARIGVSGGYQKGLNGFSQLDLRFALHDMLDPQGGYPRDAQIEFGHLTGRYYTDPSQVQLQTLDLIRVQSLSPVDAFNRNKSWRVQLGVDRVLDDNCSNCLAGKIEMGGGYAAHLFGSPALTLFGMGEGELAFAPQFIGSKGRVGVGPLLGLVLGDGAVRGLLTGRYRYEIFAVEPSYYEASAEVRWSLNTSFAAGAQGLLYNHLAWESSGGVYYYF